MNYAEEKSMAVILGIDIGTTSVKAMLLDSERGVLAVHAKGYGVSIDTMLAAAAQYQNAA